MNNTLTGLGLALVLALLAALVGPWFIDWTAYRDGFAREAGALIGAPVKVDGALDVRLLPTPYARVRGLSAGSGATAFSVDEVEFELAIAPLLRGEFKAERVKLVRPRFGVEVAADGAVRTALSGGRKTSTSAISLDRIEIVDGSAAVLAPTGRVAIERIDGSAEVASVVGPFRFDVAAGPDGRRIQARLSTSRLDDKGAMRVKLAVTRPDRSESFEADGGLIAGAKPVFDGRIAAFRPAAKGVEPWRVAAEAKGDPARVALSAIELSYAPDDRALRLGGRGEISLGKAPRFDLALESRQVDLDRFLGEGRPKTPAGVIEAVADRMGGAFAPPLEGRIAIDLRGLMLAGEVVQGVTAEAVLDAGVWRVRRAAATLPGAATVSASGAIAMIGGSLGFAGDAELAVADISGLRRWLAGGEDVGGPVKTASLKGRVQAGLAAVSIDDAALDIGGARSTGRIAWRAGAGGARDRVEAALVSQDLDLDALGVERILKSIMSGGGSDLTLALDAKSLVFAGMRMSDVTIDGDLNDSGLDVRRLQIGDAAGAALVGAGRIARGRAGHEGHVSLDVASPRLDPLIRLARVYGAPEAALQALESRASALAPLKLKVDIDANAGGNGIVATGDAAGGRLEARASSKGLTVDAPAEIDVRLVSPEGARLAALAGLALSPAVAADGGEIRIRLAGAPGGRMAGEGRFAALGLDIEAKGAVAYAPVAGLSAEGAATLRSADLTTFGEAIGRLTPGLSPKTPVALEGKVALGPEGLRLEGLKGKLAEASVTGEVAVSPSRAFEGRLAFDALPASAIAAIALPWPPGTVGPDARSSWPAAPFAPSAARGLTGRLAVSAAKMPLVGAKTATDAAFVLAIRPAGVAIEDFVARLDGGRLAGSANIARNGDDATVGLAMTLEGFAIERLAGASPEASPAAGEADLKLDLQATGRSPAALAGAFTGAGGLSLRGARLRRLDVAGIDRIEPRIETGATLLEAGKIAEALDRELAAGDLSFDRATLPFTVSNGVARFAAIAAESPAARVGGGATVDLRRMTVDADLTLQPKRNEAPQIGVSFEGPLSAPKRRIDATGFTGWLSVRAVERETGRIEAMEAESQERARVARLRAEEERKKAEEEKRRLEAERARAEAERRKREAEMRPPTEPQPKPGPPAAPGLPPLLDITPPAAADGPPRASSPTGLFGPQGKAGQGRPTTDAPPPPPQSILPPGASPAR